jgi:hypothetical protein
MKRIVSICAGLLIAAALFFVTGELLLRAVGYSAPIWYSPDPQLGWRLRPGVTGSFTKEGHSVVQVNAVGRRDTDPGIQKPDDVYRIAVLGDSYSEAMQVERDQTYWALLPARLVACSFAPGKRIEVLNFGVSGYGTAQEYLTLKNDAIRYRPDLVLLQFTNGNDVANNSRALEDEKERPFFVLEADGGLRADESFAGEAGFRKRQSMPMELLRQASDHSRVLQLLHEVRNVRIMQNAHAAADPGGEQGLQTAALREPRIPSWEEAWKITEGLIVQTANYARNNGARFMLFTVPHSIQVHPDRKLREALQAKLAVDDLLYPDRRLSELSKRSGVAVVPLAPEMQRMAEEGRLYFHGFDDSNLGRGHWNVAGHRTAADLIAGRLCSEK